MKVLCAGGGSGGHVTPVLAVINELSKLDSSLEVIFVTDRAFESQARGLADVAAVPIDVRVIAAGKLRRYHDESLLQKITDIKTISLNVRDMAKIAWGYAQSWNLMRSFRPDVVFAKGGYVCLPLGYAAKTRGVPVVIHDSDTRAGLTNRLLSKFAAHIATGAPLEYYGYPEEKSTYTGVPIDPKFQPLTKQQQLRAKKRLGFQGDRPLLTVVGGGLGAHSINKGMVAASERLVEEGFDVYHVTGKRDFDTVSASIPSTPHYQAVDFVYDNMFDVLGAADVVISRGSATFLQELAALKKVVIVVPAAHLGDQIKNAHVYEEAGAVRVMSDKAVQEPERLLSTVLELRDDIKGTQHMKDVFHGFAVQGAALHVAEIISATYNDS